MEKERELTPTKYLIEVRENVWGISPEIINLSEDIKQNVEQFKKNNFVFVKETLKDKETISRHQNILQHTLYIHLSHYLDYQKEITLRSIEISLPRTNHPKNFVIEGIEYPKSDERYEYDEKNNELRHIVVYKTPEVREMNDAEKEEEIIAHISKLLESNKK